MSLRPNTRSEVRNRYKVAVDAEEGRGRRRRRREDNMVEIRKIKREEILLKKRCQGLETQSSLTGTINAGTIIENKVDNLPSIINMIRSNDGHMQLEAITQYRILLSKKRNPPIEEVINSGVVPRFVEFLMRADYPQLQFEAAWALTNIASGTSENTKVVVDHGAVPIFVQLLSSPCDDIRELAVWALGNIACYSSWCRDIVLSNGALVSLLAQLNEDTRLSMLRKATWTLAKLCGGKPQPPIELMGPALPVLQRLLYSNDEEVLTGACWALSYLSDGDNDKIQVVIEAGVCQRLVEFLLHPSPKIQFPALRAVGNIVTGDDAQTQYIVDIGALPCLLSLLNPNHEKRITKRACWAISNITARDQGQIQKVIEAQLIGPLINLLHTSEFDVKKEAALAISKVTVGGNHYQIRYLVKEKCIKPLCNLLACPDPRVVTICLEALENILEVGESDKYKSYSEVNDFAQLIDEAEGFEKIENLLSLDNSRIYEKAVKILDTYWSEEEDYTLPPGVGVSDVNVPSGGFSFR